MQDAPTAKLSQRQRQVLELIRQGKSNNEIAFELGIGLGTVKQHVVALFRKLKVTSRTKALSRPVTEETFSGHPFLCNSEDVVLERRPCVVLSLTLEDTEPGLHRTLRQNLSAIAQETGDILISWRGAGCDLILGVDQVSETDCLRALRGAWKTAHTLAQAMDTPSRHLKGAIATGLAVASMFRHGGWSGEVMASSAIALARSLASQAPPGTLHLDKVFPDLLRLCGANLEERHRNRIPLNTPEVLQWSSQETPVPFHGRDADLARLTALFDIPVPGLHVLSGAPGSGKSRICREFAHHGRSAARMVRLVRCLPSQASAPFLDTSSATVWGRDDFLLCLQSASGNELLVLDDTHWLSESDRNLVLDIGHGGSKMLLFTDRAEMGCAPLPALPDKPRLATEQTALRLGPLPKSTIKALVAEALASGTLPGPGRTRHVESITMLAAGNPGFALELAREVTRTQGFAVFPENRRHLPMPIVTTICSVLDGLHLDRCMLRHIASFPEGVTVGKLAHALGESPVSICPGIAKAEQYNVLVQENSGHVRFAHPMVRHVVDHLGMES